MKVVDVGEEWNETWSSCRSHQADWKGKSQAKEPPLVNEWTVCATSRQLMKIWHY